MTVSLASIKKLREMRWKRITFFALVAVIIIAFLTKPVASMLLIISLIALLVGAYAICRWKRGPYKYRRRTPKHEPAHSKRVRMVVKNLAEGESLVWESRQHFIAVLPWILLGVVTLITFFIIGAAVSWIVGLIILTAGGLWSAFKITWWIKYRFCITNQRVFVVEGIIRLVYNEMRIESITDRKTTESILSKILAWLRFIETEYGDVRLESPGQTQDIEDVGPLPCVNRISELLDRHRTPPAKESDETAILRQILEILQGAESPHTTIIDPFPKPPERGGPSDDDLSFS